jgi:transposase InsO family protein
MTEEEKMQVAVFRFGVISDFVNGSKLASGEKTRLIREKCARKWQIPFSEKTRIGRSTILRWVRLYNKSGGKLDSLRPGSRKDCNKSRAMDEDTCLGLMSLRNLMPEATAAHLIREMEAQKLVSPGVSLNLSTVYRFLHRQGLMYPAKKLPQDRRKFEAELPNDLWQSDVMHGPMVKVGDKLRKSYLIAFIDDHSRLVPYGCFYLSERLDSYLDALKWALLKRGLPRKLYVDNGPAFRSKHLEYVAASLGIALIHSKPYTPQGRGKIERFFKTVRSDFLPGFKGKSLADINEAFETWLTDVYHQRVHGGTGQTPFMRFTANTQCIRSAPENLNDHFRKTARRRVAKDRTIVLNDRLYEGPVVLIGKRVELLYHADMLDQVEVRYNQKSYGIARLVDIYVNCRVKRDKNRNAQITPATSPARYQGGKLLSRRPDNE